MATIRHFSPYSLRRTMLAALLFPLNLTTFMERAFLSQSRSDMRFHLPSSVFRRKFLANVLSLMVKPRSVQNSFRYWNVGFLTDPRISTIFAFSLRILMCFFSISESDIDRQVVSMRI